MPKIFVSTPKKHPRTCPAQSPANIPGVGGKMIHPTKKTCNEKLQSLHAKAVAQLDQLVNQFIESTHQPEFVRHLIQSQMILIDLMAALLEEPE